MIYGCSGDCLICLNLNVKFADLELRQKSPFYTVAKTWLKLKKRKNSIFGQVTVSASACLGGFTDSLESSFFETCPL